MNQKELNLKVLNRLSAVSVINNVTVETKLAFI
jgi:hypothetical protein